MGWGGVGWGGSAMAGIGWKMWNVLTNVLSTFCFVHKRAVVYKTLNQYNHQLAL